MKELSLNLLDIAENSIAAHATLIKLTIAEDGDRMEMTVSDDGDGMSPEQLKLACDPFYTGRTTRRVGLGLPLLRLAAEQTGGSVRIDSTEGIGTVVRADFNKASVDCPPLGDVISTLVALIQGSPEIDFEFEHKTAQGSVELSTPEMRRILGDVPISDYEVIGWVGDNLRKQYRRLEEKKASLPDGSAGEFSEASETSGKNE